MKRKALISIALILIMLLNCIMPLFKVYAAEDEEIQLNLELYKAVKASISKDMTDKGYTAKFNDHDQTVTVDTSKVKELYLKEGDISDITGLDAFTSLEYLDLSGNHLSKSSNLSVLNAFSSRVGKNEGNFRYLDLSSNNIEDIKDIDALVTSLEKDGEAVVLSNQKVKVVTPIDLLQTSENNDNPSNAKKIQAKLPPILSKAGLFKYRWLSSEVRKQSDYENILNSNSIESGYYLAYGNISSDNSELEINITDGGTSFYEGIIKVLIEIDDEYTEASSAVNINRARVNPLKGSRFELYFVVSDDRFSIIPVNDTYLYNAIKEQLTAGQTVNPNLNTYKYETDESGNISSKLYEYDTITIGDITYQRLYCEVNASGTPVYEYLYNPTSKTLYKYVNDTTIGRSIEASVKSESFVSNNGSLKSGYRISNVKNLEDSTYYSYNEIFINGIRYHRLYANTASGEPVYEYLYDPNSKIVYTYVDESTIGTVLNKKATLENDLYTIASDNLYSAAYDEAQTFVIRDNILINKIKSLILNNKLIKDLTGLEKFVGLTSNLNISHNDILDFNKLFELEQNKLATEQLIRSRYENRLRTKSSGNLQKYIDKDKTLNGTLDTTTSAYKDLSKKVIEILTTLAASTEEDTTKIAEAKTNAKKSITDTINEAIQDTDDKKGLDTTLADTIGDMNENIGNIYGILGRLYDIYNDEYKITSLLTDELNYNTFDEYKVIKDIIEANVVDTERVKSLLTSEFEFLKTLEVNNALSELDKEMLSYYYGVNFESTETETPLGDKLNKWLEDNNDAGSDTFLRQINNIRRMNLYSEMANYCLIKRMNEDTNANECYEEDYLARRINELTLEGIPTDLEEETLEKVKADHADKTDYTQDTPYSLYDIYSNYEKKQIEYNKNKYSATATPEKVNACRGEYIKLDGINTSDRIYTLDELRTAVLEANSTVPHIEYVDDVYDELGNEIKASIIKDMDLIDVTEDFYFNSDEGVRFLYDQLISLSNKFLQGSLNNIELAKLKVLDISYNNEYRYDCIKIPDVSVLSKLTTLAELNASGNSITDNLVDWASLTNLRKLILAENNITEMTPFLNLENLKVLNLSKNDISGELPINRTNGSKLLNNIDELDLSYNKIEDIRGILEWLDEYVKGRDYSSFFSNDNSKYINLDNQELSITIEEPIYMTSNPTTVYIDLPNIFAQANNVDKDRVEVSIDRSSNIDPKSNVVRAGARLGSYLTLKPKTTGVEVATFRITPMNGAYDVDDCFANGTYVNVYYNVTNVPTVTKVTVSPHVVTLKPGTTQEFTATVEGENLTDTTVTWSISGNVSEDTKINEDGTLTVAENETATTIKVTAVSNYDKNVSDTVDVSISEEEEYVNIVSSKPSIAKGEKATFTVSIKGFNTNENSKVDWKIENNSSSNTILSDEEGEIFGEDGILTEKINFTLGEDEGDEVIYVYATLRDNPEIYGRVKVIPEGVDDPTDPENPDPQDPTDPENPDPQGVDLDLGYTTKDEYIVGLKTKTPISTFKTILLDNEDYNVVVKESKDDEAQVVTSGNMKTGMFVEIQDKDGNTVKDKNGDPIVYEVVVKGDVNGDGVANALDSNLIKAIRNEISSIQFSGAQKEAADINSDGTIDIKDSKLLLYHRAEVNGYDLDYNS